jgi:hypothetical protein
VLSAIAQKQGTLDEAGSAALRDWRTDTAAWSRARGGA